MLPVCEEELRDLYVSNEAIGWMTDELGFDFKQREKDFSILPTILTASEVHPASYPTGTEGSSSGKKAAGV
jgi:hypothetical protein